MYNLFKKSVYHYAEEGKVRPYIRAIMNAILRLLHQQKRLVFNKD